ncbi:MAG: hypothetical protein PHH54_06630 [Candidatus Nanoarchaeia archaeon]|nr:hypothetical protein [Candidatus Nanoarchaeia archaeon]MDD5741631.1 hypothetical protein [Candidatus Nanoarchaeia archaeon]
MVSTSVIIQEFPQTLKQYSTKVEEKQLDGMVSGIDRLRKQNPAVYDEKSVAMYLQERSKTLKGMVEEYFIASIANKFPLISDELFQLKRHLTLKAEDKTWKVVRDDTEREEDAENIERDEKRKIVTRRIEVPLFVYTPLFNGNHTAKLGSFTKQTGSSWSSSYKRTTVTVEAKLPGSIGPNLKNAYRSALSHYFSVLSEMFTSPAAGDIMYAEGNFAQPEVGATWIPTLESLSVNVDTKLIHKKKVLDPAMILKVKGKNYLVQTWRVDDEEPLEHYLREYSIGDLKGKLK